MKLAALKTLSGGKAAVEKSDKGILVSLVEKDRDPIASVIELTLTDSAMDLPAR